MVKGCGAAVAVPAGRVGGAFAALAFASAPAVAGASTHVEPLMFDAAWALLVSAVLVLYGRLPRRISWIAPALAGAMVAAGAADTSLFLLAAPVFVAQMWSVSRRTGGKCVGPLAVFCVSAVAAFLLWANPALADFDEYVKQQKEFLTAIATVETWYAIPFFSVLPFVVSAFSVSRAFGKDRTYSELIFHAMLTVVSVLATATALSPSSVAIRAYAPPVFSTLAAAAVAGYVAAYWFALSTIQAQNGETAAVFKRFGFAIGLPYALVAVVAAAISMFSTFDPGAGSFADAIARRIVSDLGDRKWIVTDGALDAHLRLVAAEQRRPLRIVSLAREKETAYAGALAAAVEEDGIGGQESKTIAEALRKHGDSGLSVQRIVPFIQKWFASDSGAARQAAVFGAPDMWLYAGVEPVAERFFFGADPAKAHDWTRDEKELDEVLGILHAPGKAWGSHSMSDRRTRNTYSRLDLQRLNLRRHLGFVATDSGCALQEKGRKLQIAGSEKEAQALYDRAFAIYEIVLGRIDGDNVSALFNELELLGCRHAGATAKTKTIHGKLAKIKEDESRRYVLGNLGLYYGYICNPEIMLRYGVSLLRSGSRKGEGLGQIRKALDFIPSQNKETAELALLASWYAGGGEADRRKAREMYDSALARNASNREALLGLARLAMLEGDAPKAAEYLERATKGAEDSPALRRQLAMLYFLKDELEKARESLLRATDENHADVEAWSLLASVDMRIIEKLGDTSKNPAAAARKKELETEIDTLVLPSIEKQSSGPNDRRLLATKGMILMQRGGQENVEMARDAFVAASKDGSAGIAASDVILGLDIRLNDTEDAKRQAAATLAADPGNPMANYVMGSLAMQKDDLETAELHLRAAAGAKRPAPLALNDLAEALRRRKNYEEAEAFARKAVEAAPGLYVAWETLGSILLDAGKGFDEAEACVQKACDLSKDRNGKYADVRMLMSLARIQIKNGKTLRAKSSLSAVRKRINELSDFEKREFEELMKSAK